MTDEKNNFQLEGGSEPASSDPTLTRQEFIAKVVKGAALAGGLATAPMILDKFLVPKAYASTSSQTACGKGNAGDSTFGGTDTVSQNGKNVTCAGFGDATVTSGKSSSPADTACSTDINISIGCGGP
jgi:hypothetical protein